MESAVPKEGSEQTCMRSVPWKQIAAEEFGALSEKEAPKDAKTGKSTYCKRRKAIKRRKRPVHQVYTSNQRLRLLMNSVEEMLASFEDTPKPGTNSSGLQNIRSDADKTYTDEQLRGILEGVENAKPDAIMLRSPRVLSNTRKSASERDSTSAAPKVTEPVALEPSEEQNLKCEPMEVTDLIPEPIPLMEQKPLVALTITEAATSAERSQSPNQGEPTCTVAVTEAAALSGSSPLLSSQKPTCAAQMSPELEPSSVGQNLHQEPVAREGLSRPRDIRGVAKSQVRTLARKLRDATENLAAMAKQQASCMELFSKTMQQIADNDNERNKMFRTLVENHKSQVKTASASADTSSMMRNSPKLRNARRRIVAGRADIQHVSAPTGERWSILHRPSSMSKIVLRRSCNPSARVPY